MCEMTNENFYNQLRIKLIHEKLISINDEVIFKAIYKKKLNGIIIQHYLVSIPQKQQKFLVKTVKEKDYSYTVMNYLLELNKTFGSEQFPYALTEPFVIGQHNYIVTSYLEGRDLNSMLPMISNEALLQISSALNHKLKCIHSVINNEYSEGNRYNGTSFAEIMINKIYKQFNDNCTKIFTKSRNINRLLVAANSILTNATYSKPTLIHMDIKPENIIVSSQGDVCLIDFELSRFGDLEYEWTNLLIKTLHAYDEKFKKYVLLPIIEKNFFPLEQALKIDKYKIYMLYLSMNLHIYYLKCEKECPKEIIALINTLLDQFT